MITEPQLIEIRNYLLAKKLPIDILIEINDHFVSQILDLQREENLGFEEAFEKVKENWKEDLTLSWNGSSDLEDSTPFIRNVRQQLAIENFWASFKYTLIALYLIFFSGIFFNQWFFKYFLLITLLFFSFFPFINYLKNLKDFRLSKKYSNYILTLHQGGAYLFLGILGVSLQLDIRLFQHSIEIQNLINFKPSDFEISEILILIFGVLTLILMSIFSIISQHKYLKQIQKVKPFLKYL